MKTLTINIPQELNDYLDKKAKEYNLPINELIIRYINEYCYEYEDDYPSTSFNQTL